MRHQPPNRKVSLEITDAPPTVKPSSNYQTLNVNEQKPQLTVYESLNSNNRDPAEYEKPANEITSSERTPQASSDTYTSLGARNVQQKPYVSINRSAVADTTYEGIHNETSHQSPTEMTGEYASLGTRDAKPQQSYVSVNRK